MVIKIIRVLVLWMKVASALEGLRRKYSLLFHNIILLTHPDGFTLSREIAILTNIAETMFLAEPISWHCELKA